MTLTVDTVVEVVSSWASPVLVRTKDGGEWWVKDPKTSLSAHPNEYRKALANEYVVAKLGQLIGSPIWESALIEIPPDIRIPAQPRSRRVGEFLVPGIGWASRHQVGRTVHANLRYRDKADNMRRYVGLLALFDWCTGSNPGYLYGAERFEIYSRSCGAFFGGPWWTAESLQTVREGFLPPFYYGDWNGANRKQLQELLSRDRRYSLDSDEIETVAGKLEKVTETDISQIIDGIPLHWGIDDDEREVLGVLLSDRRIRVADRLRQLGDAA